MTEKAGSFPQRALLAMAPTLFASAAGCKLLVDHHVHVNQHGYLPDARKMAILRSDAPTPQPWRVVDGSGQEVAVGTSRVRSGVDPESGDRVHWIDFSALSTPGEGYRVVVGDEDSYPFAVGQRLYEPLRKAAMSYFYHNRSGTPIEIPWAGGWQWTHPPGHLSDANITCVSGCAYELNALGGWYDAGDHGKYVVNGGISVWTIMNLYERTQRFGRGSAPLERLGDGSLELPEQKNGIPDYLDEARWEVDFLLRMQVPEGQPGAGMVHHKLHDSAWSTLGMVPPEYFAQRFLHPPSTAATLNLAATAAQAFRLFRDIDPAFAERCRIGAIRAWNAARRSEPVYAPQYSSQGGGPYDDTDVSDEMYWAAAELFITFGNDALLRVIVESKHHLRFPVVTGHEKVRHHTSMTWQSTAALGAISLLVTESHLPSDQREAIEAALVQAADGYLARIEAQGYRLPMQAGSNGHYPWGSNSLVANNGVVLALAYDLTGEEKYYGGVTEALDYLLGRNPLNFSYVSGFGDDSLKNPHHRFWAHQAIARFPNPPPGALAGGPNSRKQDPTSGRLGDCAPLRCYIDHVNAWSVNEVAINWNAPLAWLAAFVDEQSSAQRAEPGRAARAPAAKAARVRAAAGRSSAPDQTGG